MIRRIVCGGQTGVDRAALDVALRLGVQCGGWVPRGRLAEDGVIPSTYPGLAEAPDERPETRTALNVRDSDATLIVSRGELSGGSRFTARSAREQHRPCLHVNLAAQAPADAVREVRAWLRAVRPAVLHVAGPRASEDSEAGREAERFLDTVLREEGGGRT
jgi:hypothetical protein